MVGEKELSGISNVWQMVAIVLMKYGMIGVVVLFLGYMNWLQNGQLISMMQQSIRATEQSTHAISELTKAIERR
jgi:hypothetical protein